MNKSGISPRGERVLVKPDIIDEKKGDSLIHIPDTVKEKHQQASIAGILIESGPDAWTDFSEPFAKPGDRVMFAKYGGLMVQGEDGADYRILNDTDIVAVISEGVSLGELHSRKRLGVA